MNDGLQDVGSPFVPYKKDISTFRGGHMSWTTMNDGLKTSSQKLSDNRAFLK